MWVRMAVGAVVGLAVGYLAATGAALWVVLGITGGYAAGLWRDRMRARRAGQPQI